MIKRHKDFRLTPISSAIALTFICALPAQAVQIQFEEVPPTSGSDIKVSDRVWINGDEQSISFQKQFQTGDQDNGETYGLMKDYWGNAAVFSLGEDYICRGKTTGIQGSGTDFTALLERNATTYLITQFECQTGGMYYSEVVKDNNGILSPVSNTLKFIDQSNEWGGWVHCAGSVTPWNTYLGGEEYEPDANKIEKDETSDKYYNDKVKSYWLGDYSMSSPYHNGWITEVDINKKGEASYIKHYTLGRFSHELGYVMPDARTVYLTDDGTNDILFMFVAEKANDLSSGTLYAAKWHQTRASGGGSAQLEWISLGKAKSKQIRKSIEKGIAFSDMFSENTANCTIVSPNEVTECLEVKPGMDKLASRLESRRYAALLGATHEFRKMEGFTFAAERNQAYIAISEVGRGMLDNINDPDKVSKNYDDLDKDGIAETGNHIRVSMPDYCGAIYAMDMGENINDSDNKAIDSQYVATNMNSILASGTENGMKSPELCAENNEIMAQPDNIAMINGSNTLLIGEDGDHKNNMVWAYDLDTDQLTRIATVPEGAETTSPYLHEVDGDYYITLVAQHPKDPATGTHPGESITGVIGPIDLTPDQ